MNDHEDLMQWLNEKPARLTAPRDILPEPTYETRGARNELAFLPTDVLVIPRTAPFVCRPTSHLWAQLNICLCASADVIVEGRVFRLHPGSAMLLFPHQFHHYRGFEPGGDVYWLAIYFLHPDYAPLSPLRNRVVRPTSTAWPRLRELVAAALAHYEHRTKGGGEAGHWLNLLLMALLMSPSVSKRNSPRHCEAPGAGRLRLIEAVVRHVNEHLDGPMEIADVARAVHVSASHLRRVFRANMGLGLGEYVRRSRIARAGMMLSGSDKSAGEVSHACGFSSLYAFSRAFKQTVGLSPRSYRRRSDVLA